MRWAFSPGTVLCLDLLNSIISPVEVAYARRYVILTHSVALRASYIKLITLLASVSLEALSIQITSCYYINTFLGIIPNPEARIQGRNR